MKNNFSQLPSLNVSNSCFQGVNAPVFKAVDNMKVTIKKP